MRINSGLGKHVYNPQMNALNKLIDTNPRLKMGTAEYADLLGNCDYVVTQNSAVALDGFFFRKPSILFAHSDFHHIATNVSEIGAEQAFATVLTKKPDFDLYLYWFLQMQSINAGRSDAEANILATVRRNGWKI